MTWAGFYLICLVVGFVMSLLAVVSGIDHLHLPFHGHELHLPHLPGAHAHGPHVHVDGGFSRLASFNFSALMALIAWFGGAGYLLSSATRLTQLLVFPAAMITGLAGATIVNYVLVRILSGNEKPLPSGDLVGTIATVTMPIRERGTGEIVYALDESRKSSGARSETGQAIQPGAEVVVTRYEEGIAYVRPSTDLLESTSTSSTITEG
jgi:membrane protein implicated in regulation of membrane protease activity